MSKEPYFKTRYVEVSQRDAIWRSIASYLNAFLNIQSDATVLELGTGYGSWIRAINAKNKLAVDTNPEIKRVLCERGITGVDARVGKCTELGSVGDASVDVVLASNLLEHLEYNDVQLCLREISRVLKSGGKLCLIQPNFATCSKKYFDDYTHRTIFTHVSLRDISVAHGFKVERLWKRFLPFSMNSRASRLSFLVPLYLRSPIKPLAGQMALIAVKE